VQKKPAVGRQKKPAADSQLIAFGGLG
jgi:hypothetical protein